MPVCAGCGGRTAKGPWREIRVMIPRGLTATPSCEGLQYRDSCSAACDEKIKRGEELNWLQVGQSPPTETAED